MEFLIIYLGSAIGSLSVAKLFAKYIDGEIKNRGYEFVNKPKNKFGGILDTIAVCSFFFMPGINVIFSIYLLWNKEKACDEVIEKQIIEGKIIKVEDKINLEDEVIKSDLPQVIIYNVNNEITREEKIEFLKQEYSRLTGEEFKGTRKRKQKQKRI